MFSLGIIGGGRMGRTHIRALRASSIVHTTAIAEPDPSAAAALRSEGLEVFESVTAMLNADRLDGVLVAAPTDLHVDLVSRLVDVGLPVLCEKPFGYSPQDARGVAHKAALNGTVLQVAYWRRFVPGLQQLREQILGGALGSPQMLVCLQWDQSPPPASFRRRSGGIFLDMGVHEIDQIRWLTGQDVVDVAVSKSVGTQDAEADGDPDSAAAVLTLSDGTAALISLGRYFPSGDLVAAEYFGTTGHERVEVIRPADGEQAQLEALCLQAESFARRVSSGAAEAASGEDAIRTLEIALELTTARTRRSYGDTLIH